MNSALQYLVPVVFFVSSFALQAQDDGVPTNSEECLTMAKTRAMDTISAPFLTALGTFPISNAPFFGSSRFVLNTAKAIAWLYTFRSKLDNNGVAILTYRSKSTGNCVALQIPSDTANIARDVISEQYASSEGFMTELATNNTFLSILAQHNELAGDSVFCVSSNGLGDLFPPDANIWLADFVFNGGKLTCIYDATTKTKSICNSVLTSVNESQENTQPMCYPSPATTYSLLQIPTLYAAAVREIRVYDIHGTEFFSAESLKRTLFNGSAVIPVSSLAAGTYFVRVVCSAKTFIVPLVVTH